MIIRQWRGRAEAERADAYPRHFRTRVADELKTVDGFLGADLVQRALEDGIVEFTVLSRWASMDAIHAFAGDDADRAVVEPGAKAALSEFDDTVTHHAVIEHVPRLT